MIIFKEIGTLPLGPVEISTWWFARSRLAFSTIGLRLWAAASEGVPALNDIRAVVSRCMENWSEYMIAVLEALLSDRPDLAHYANLVLWADGAPNMKSRKVIGTMSFRTLQKFNFWSVSFKYFATHHGKTELDGFFGALSKPSSTRRSASRSWR